MDFMLTVEGLDDKNLAQLKQDISILLVQEMFNNRGTKTKLEIDLVAKIDLINLEFERREKGIYTND